MSDSGSSVRRRAAIAAAFLLVVMAGARPDATVVIAPTFEELVAGAREIFVAEVVSRHSEWVDTPQGAVIVTLVTFSISESLKGGLLTQTSLEFLGGTVGDTTFAVSGMPTFSVGDRDVIFVGSRNGVSPLVAFTYGRFRIVFDERTGADTVRLHDGRTFAGTAALGRPSSSGAPARAMTLSAFREQVMAQIRTTGGK